LATIFLYSVSTAERELLVRKQKAETLAGKGCKADMFIARYAGRYMCDTAHTLCALPAGSAVFGALRTRAPAKTLIQATALTENRDKANRGYLDLQSLP
jgi:hypothetical protein